MLICDTDTITTTIWSDVYFGRCPGWVRTLAHERRHDTYLLCDVDVPWVDDAQRDLPHRRREFFDHCRQILETHNRPYVIIHGDWEARFHAAVAAIDRMLGPLDAAGAPPVAARERLERELLPLREH